MIVANSIQKLDSPSFYNLLISQAILHLKNKEYDQCESYLAKAGLKFTKNWDPFYLKTINSVNKSLTQSY